MKNHLEIFNEGRVLKIPTDTEYWLLRADGGKYFDDFFLNNYVGIANNEVTLDLIENSAQLNTDIGRTIEGYKSLFKEVYVDANNQQIAHAAGRTMNFIEDMKINDILIVPSKMSNNFLVGVIISEPYELEVRQEEIQIDGKLTRSPYFKRRKVTWIKTIERTSISAEMRWIMSAHQTIFNLTPYSEHIDNLLSPIYIKGDQCYASIKIGTEKGVSVNQWFELYGIIKSESGEKSNEITVKSNVRSPGYIEIIAAATEMPAVLKATAALLGLAVTIGKVKLPGIEVMGIIPYFFYEGKIQRERMEIENENVQLENEMKKLKLKELRNKVDRPDQSTLANDLEISPYNPGTVISVQEQMDNVNVENEDES